MIVEHHKRPSHAFAVEEKYNASFVGYFSIKDKDGKYTDSPVEVYYQPNPKTELGHTNYFGLFQRDGTTFICNAASAFEEPISGIKAENGNIIFSGHNHDYRRSSDNSVFVDGGRSYLRCGFSGSPPEQVQLVIDKDRLVPYTATKALDKMLETADKILDELKKD